MLCGMLMVCVWMGGVENQPIDDFRSPYLYGSKHSLAPLMGIDEPPINAANFHFPPLSYDPNLPGSNSRGLLNEILKDAMLALGLNVKTHFYPPSRYMKGIDDGVIELFSSDVSIAHRYLATFICSKPMLFLPIVLYQNKSLYPKDFSNLRVTLTQMRILVPKESKALFASALNRNNQILPVVLPRNMARMFVAQREPFMVDYANRAQTELDQLSPDFIIGSYLLSEAKPVLCTHKRLAKSRKILDGLYQYVRASENSEYLRLLENKYGFRVQWQPTHLEQNL